MGGELKADGSGKVYGVEVMTPREAMSPGAAKARDFYAMKPDAPIIMREFGYYSLEAWEADPDCEVKPSDWEGFQRYLAEQCKWDDPGVTRVGGLGWTEAEFIPRFDVAVLEDRGDHELVRDGAGRHVLFFKGRRSGFMPEYVDHPVKDRRTWEENCLWRLDPKDPRRYEGLEARMAQAREGANRGNAVVQGTIGGYMYLRSLMGPEDLLYKFHDDPGLIHECMKAWLALADAVTEAHQRHVTIDELFIAEDICYKCGPLISPDMMREFLFPYYAQLLDNIKRRNIDRTRHVFFQLDTDGWSKPVLPLYASLGMDYCSPFEVASGCDVVAIGKEFPDLLMSGGIDKRILAMGCDAIDKHLDHIMPAMRRRGGYTPTSDHGVPAEVPFKDFLYYRRRLLEYSK
ncbi:MAG: hypothetical protein FWE70_03270 [Oscillospiraceae bacterium]|nr:hypothetical protein [Oscillospiraceae bacterium]